MPIAKGGNPGGGGSSLSNGSVVLFSGVQQGPLPTTARQTFIPPDPGSGDVGTPATVPSNPSASSLTDNFDDNSLSANWTTGQIYAPGVATTGVTVSEANQRTEITAPAATGATRYNGRISAAVYSLYNDAIYVKLPNRTSLQSGEIAALVFGADINNHYALLIDAGVLYLQKFVGSAQTNLGNYTLVSTDVWLRLSHQASDDTIKGDTASTTASNPPLSGDWTNRLSATRDTALSPTNGSICFVAGCYTSIATPTVVQFDGFNTATTGSTAYSLTASGGSYALTGTATLLKAGRLLTAVPGSYSVTGTATGLTVQRKVTAAVGSYSLTGTSTALRIARRLVEAVGSYALTGTSTTLKKGYPLAGAVGSYSITGTATGLLIARKLSEAVGSYAVTGTATALRAARTLSAAAGSYSVTGTSAALLRGHPLAVAPGSYALTGTTASLLRGRLLAAVPGAYSISGQATALRIGRRIAATPGSYALTGTNVSLLSTRRVSLVPGAYAYTGTAATLTYVSGYVLSAGVGSYAATGTATALTAARKIAANPGSYVLTGSPVGLRRGFLLSTTAGAYSLTGSAAQLAAARRLAVTPGAYVLSGSVVTFLYSAAPIAVLTGRVSHSEAVRGTEANANWGSSSTGFGGSSSGAIRTTVSPDRAA